MARKVPYRGASRRGRQLAACLVVAALVALTGLVFAGAASAAEADGTEAGAPTTGSVDETLPRSEASQFTERQPAGTSGAEESSQRALPEQATPERVVETPAPADTPNQSEASETTTSPFGDGAQRELAGSSDGRFVDQDRQTPGPRPSPTQAVEDQRQRADETRGHAEQLASRTADGAKETARRVPSESVDPLVDRLGSASSALDAITGSVNRLRDGGEHATPALRTDLTSSKSLLASASYLDKLPGSSTGSPSAAGGPRSAAGLELERRTSFRGTGVPGSGPLTAEWTGELRALPGADGSPGSIAGHTPQPNTATPSFTTLASATVAAASISLLAVSLFALGAIGLRRRLPPLPANWRPAPFIALLTRPG